jgi:hypothetical protein
MASLENKIDLSRLYVTALDTNKINVDNKSMCLFI